MRIKIFNKCFTFISFLSLVACGNKEAAQTETVSADNTVVQDSVSEDEESVEVSIWKRECSLRDSLRKVSPSLYFKHLDSYNNDTVSVRRYFGDFELENFRHYGDLTDLNESYKMKFANFVAHKQLNDKYHLVQYSDNFREECLSYVHFVVLDSNLAVMDDHSYGVNCPDEEFDSAPECLYDSIGKYIYLWYSKKDEVENLGDSYNLTTTDGYLINDTISSQMYKYEKTVFGTFKVDKSGHFFKIGGMDTFNVDVMLKEMKKIE
ncbi:MAG: hypothetical protein MJY63_04900 [Paludibacteraceae bacterium]|nr:hypothetical protein [Paludibacteraceae bacterium]